MKKTLLPLLFIAALGLQGCSSLSSLIEKPDEEKTVEEFYVDATEAFQNQDWEIAILNYEKLKSFYPYGPYAEQTHLELAYAYYRYDEPESAILELEEFIRIFPKHKQLAYAYYLKALAADSVVRSWLDNFITDPATRDVKSAKRAYQYYTDVLNRFPDSQYATVSSKRLIILRNQMARHEYKVAQFYMDKQAYLAAANRGKYILQNYPQAAVTMKTLQMMQLAYAKLGMSDNLADVQKVYEINQSDDIYVIDADFKAEPPESTDEANKQSKKQDQSWWSSMTSWVSDLF